MASAGCSDLNKDKYEEPVLVSGTDGVGTKLKIAFAMDKHDTIGIDAVAMCVNDIIVQGAEPLFFLDYLACGKVVPEKIEAIVKGIADGCVQSGCALIGGETAEMPGMYHKGSMILLALRLESSIRKRSSTATTIRPGDVVLGLASSGMHSNGFSLVRKLLLEDNGYTLQGHVEELGDKLGNVLLGANEALCEASSGMLEDVAIKGMAHITGGGFIENIPRVLPDGVNVDIQYGSWPILPIFSLMQRVGNITNNDMFRTFNMGIGMVVIVAADDAEKAIAAAEAQGEKAYRLGVVTEGERVVTFQGADV